MSAFKPGFVPEGWDRGGRLLVSWPSASDGLDRTRGHVRQAEIQLLGPCDPVNEGHIAVVLIDPHQVDDVKRWLAWWREGWPAEVVRAGLRGSISG